MLKLSIVKFQNDLNFTNGKMTQIQVAPFERANFWLLKQTVFGRVNVDARKVK